MGPIPHHMHQQHEHAALTDQQGKPESYYFPPQLNAADNHFDYTFMGLEPTGNKVETTGIFFDRLEDGRIVETWANYDLHGLLQQLQA